MADDDNTEKLDTLTDEVRKLDKTMTEYVTVMRRHMVEEERNGRRVDKLIEDVDKRLRSVEAWKEKLAGGMPAKLIDGDDIDRDITALKAEVSEVWKSVNEIKLLLAKYSGGALVIWGGCQLVLVPLVQALWKLAFGS